MNFIRIKQCLVLASIYSLFMFFHGVAYTDNSAEETLEERIPDKLIERDDQFFTFTFENDLFTESDKYYTNGARISYYDTGARMPNKIKNTLNKVPGIDITETSSIYYSVGQNL